ncbi:hypothetical protein ACS0TY_026677 [Phlomoides rotata]
MYCQVIPSKEVSNKIGVDVIKVLERSVVNDYFWNEYTYSVWWTEIGEHISCNCRKFEVKGILCYHIMLVLAQKNIQTVNERYAFRRWKRCGYPSMTVEYKKFQELESIKEICNEMKNTLVNWVPATSDNIQPSQTTENTQVGSGTPILNPVVTATRRRPRSNQYISHAEEHS